MCSDNSYLFSCASKNACTFICYSNLASATAVLAPADFTGPAGSYFFKGYC